MNGMQTAENRAVPPQSYAVTKALLPFHLPYRITYRYRYRRQVEKGHGNPDDPYHRTVLPDVAIPGAVATSIGSPLNIRWHKVKLFMRTFGRSGHETRGSQGTPAATPQCLEVEKRPFR
jgi:hypothetical protein